MKIDRIISALFFLFSTTVHVVAGGKVVYEGTIKITNTAPSPDGVRFTPVWLGVHDGTFDTYDGDVAAFPGIESLAEDGSTEALSESFWSTNGSIEDATIGTAPIAPGEIVEVQFVISVVVGQPLYISYASMILPSNDFCKYTLKDTNAYMYASHHTPSFQ